MLATVTETRNGTQIYQGTPQKVRIGLSFKTEVRARGRACEYRKVFCKGRRQHSFACNDILDRASSSYLPSACSSTSVSASSAPHSHGGRVTVCSELSASCR